MTLIFSSSIKPTSTVDAMYQFKTFMVNLGYVVVSSSNGSSLVAGDIIDAPSALTTSLAYYILKQPVGATGSYGGWRREWGIQSPQNYLASPSFWKISYAVSSSHTNGGTIAIMPSGSDRRWAFERSDASFGWQTGISGSLFPTTTGSYNLIFCGDDSPPYGWYFLCYTTGATPTLQSCLIFDPMVSGTFHRRDPDPYVSVFMGTAHNPLRFPSVSLNGMFEIQSASANGPRGWMGKELFNEAFCRIPMANWQVTSNTTIVPLTGSMTTNVHTGNDDTIPTFYYRPAGNRGGSFNTEFGIPAGLKGYSTFLKIRLTNQIRNVADTYSTSGVSGSMDAIVAGDFILPWSGSVDPAI